MVLFCFLIPLPLPMSAAAAAAVRCSSIVNRARGGKSLSSQKLPGLHLLPPRCELNFGPYSPSFCFKGQHLIASSHMFSGFIECTSINDVRSDFSGAVLPRSNVYIISCIDGMRAVNERTD